MAACSVEIMMWVFTCDSVASAHAFLASCQEEGGESNHVMLILIALPSKNKSLTHSDLIFELLGLLA